MLHWIVRGVSKCYNHSLAAQPLAGGCRQLTWSPLCHQIQTLIHNWGTLWGSNNTDLLFSLVLNILPLPFSFSKIGPVLSVPSNPSKACVEMGINIDAGWQTEESSHTGARSTAGPHSEAAAGDGMKNDATVAADTGDGPDKQILELSTGLHEISQCLCGQAS